MKIKSLKSYTTKNFSNKKGRHYMPAVKQKHPNRAYMHATIKACQMPILSFFVSLLLVVLHAPSVYAATLSFGFKTGDGIVSGMIVSLDPSDAERLTPAHTNSKDYVVGVAVEPEQSSIVLDDDDSVYVATEGTVAVFVSTIGGEIQEGDLVSVSSIGGVGRKIIDGLDGQKVIGVAKNPFNKETQGAQVRELENAGLVHVGQIEVELLIGEPALAPSADDPTNVLVRIGQRIAGRSVSFSQVTISAFVVVVAFIASGALLYGAVRGSFTAIGRNPLSAKAIYRGLAQTSLLSLSVMMLGIVGGYAVLLL